MVTESKNVYKYHMLGWYILMQFLYHSNKDINAFTLSKHKQLKG